MTTSRFTALPTALISLLLMSLPVAGARAAIYCVDTPNLLESALLQANSSSQNNEIRIVADGYDVSAVNLASDLPTGGDLVISGGWPPFCAGTPSSDARVTTVKGAANQAIKIAGTRRLEFRALTLDTFALVRMRNDGAVGGYAIRWDGVELRAVKAIEVTQASAGDIQLRNLLVHDSGTAAGDCLLKMTQEENDGFSTSLLAQSTFAFNQGTKQVCLGGKEPNKLVLNNIFDGDVLQQSVFVELTQATLQHNRIQALGGLPPGADSIDNFNTAPGFVNAATRDFRLGVGSPAINRGIMVLPEGQSRFDLFGNPRWIGFRPDLGGIETAIEEGSKFFVINSDDSGFGSLRQAVEGANSNEDASIIRFNIPNGCSSRIVLNSELPALTAPLWVDGYSQLGSAPNDVETSFNAQLCATVVAGPFGFAHAFRTASTGAPMRIEGIAFGGFGAAAGNNAVLAIGNVSESVVRGNQFGGDSGFGLLAPNNLDVSISGSSKNVQVGGTAFSDRNLFGNALIGINIELGSAVRGNQVLGNWFGLERDGFTDASSAGALYIEGSDTLIRNNRFAYNDVAITIESSFAERNRIQNNVFGAAGNNTSAPLHSAVSVQGGQNNVIGAIDDQASGGNVILDCSGPAIEVGNTTPATATRIRRNLIKNSLGNMDIDLAGAGPTANDPGDIDAGPNLTMNHPVISSVDDAGGVVLVTGTIDTQPGSVLIDFYASNRCNANGRGEAAGHLGSVVTSNGSFELAIPLTIENFTPYISTTATDANGNTSEVSPCLRAPPLFVSSFE